MRHSVLLAAGLLSLKSALLFGTPPSSSAPAGLSETIVAEEKKVIWEAVVRKDAPLLRERFADEFLDVSDVGVFTKVGTIALLPDLTITDYKLSEFKVIAPVKDTAVVTYEAIQHWQINGKDEPSHVRASSVWVRRGGKWLVAFHQESNLPPAVPASK